MNRNELIQIQHDFISTFQTLTREEKLEFLNFNRYHHKRPIQDIISIFIQYPDARYLGTFEFWKNYSKESSVQFGQKVAVKLYDKQGRLSEQLFDIAQTTLHSLPKIHDTVLSDRVLTNSLAELTGNDYFIGEENHGQYFDSISDYIKQYIEEKVPKEALKHYSQKQQELALILAKYNICEEFGAFLDESNRYESFLDNIGRSIDKLDSDDNLLRIFALGNNYSKELSLQVHNLYKEVEKRTDRLIKEQRSLNEKIDALGSNLSFEQLDTLEQEISSLEEVFSSNSREQELEGEVSVSDRQLSEKQDLKAFESAMSDGIYDFIARDSDLFMEVMPEPFGDISVDASTHQDKIIVYRVNMETERLYKWLEMEKRTGALVFKTSTVDKLTEAQKTELLKFIKREYDKLTALKEENKQHSNQTKKESEGYVEYNLSDFPYKVGDFLSHKWTDPSKHTHHQIFRVVRLADEKTSHVLLDEIESTDGKAYKKWGQVGNGFLAVANYTLATEEERVLFEEVFDGKVPTNSKEDIDKDTPLAVQIKWNEGSDNDALKFLNEDHEGESITVETLKAMIQDEVYLEIHPEPGYYKVKTTIRRIDIGDGFTLNKELYQDIVDANNLDIDIQSYYESIAPEKEHQLSNQEILQLARDKMNLSEDIKVKHLGGGAFSIMKEQFGGVLNQSIVNWYPGGDLKVKDNADQLTGRPFFEEEFYKILADIITNKEIQENLSEEVTLSEQTLDEDERDKDVTVLEDISEPDEEVFKGNDDLLKNYYEMSLEDIQKGFDQFMTHSEDTEFRQKMWKNLQKYHEKYKSQMIERNLLPPETITEDISEIQQEEKQTTENLVQKSLSLDYELEEVRQKILIETVIALKLSSSEFQIRKQNNETVSLVLTGPHSIVAPLITLRATGEAEFNSINLKAALKKYPSLSNIQETFEKVKGSILQFEKGETEQVREPITHDVSLLEQFPNAEEREELDPMEDFIVMLMANEDKLTIIVDDKDVYHHKISDSNDGQQIIFEMRQDKSTDTRYLVYENSEFIKNTFGDNIPDSRLINPIALEYLEQRIEENKLKLRNQSEASQQTQEVSLFDGFDFDDKKESQDPIIPAEPKHSNTPEIKPTQFKTNFEFPSDSQSLSEFYPATPREKVKANIAAIQLLKKLSDEKRLATVEEQEVLARYVGWGGLANQFFDSSNSTYEEQRNQLKNLISQKEYAAMRESSLTAYYTDPQLIRVMYTALDNIGFKGGKILDPSMGTGNFFSAFPQSWKENSERYGVEVDQITGQIAKHLHQNTHIQVKGFENTSFINDSLDLVITNVPFAQIPILTKYYDNPYMIHDYFIQRSLDLVHDGGFVAVITSTWTMDKQDQKLRQEIAKKANLVAAARLPKNAFTAIAGTEVSSDILIFQKTSTPELSPEWLETTSISDERGNTVHYNKYFENHPEHILGEIKILSFHDGTLSITPEFSLDDLPMELGNVLSDTRIEIQPFEKKDEALPVLEEIKFPGQTQDFNIEPYTIEVVEGIPYYHNGDEIVKHQKNSSITLNVNENRQNQLSRFEKIKDRIFKQKTSYRRVFSGKGYFDSWSNFIFTSSKVDAPKIPQEVLEMLNNGHDQTIHENYRYTVAKGKDNLLTLNVEEAINTKYSYTQDYNSREIKIMQEMIDLRYTLQELLNIQHLHDISEPKYKSEYDQLRLRLNEKYDLFVQQYGAISRPENARLMRRDDYYPFLSSIEQEKENSLTHEKEYTKAPVFFEPTIQPFAKSVTVSSAGDALLASLNHKGKLDFEYMTDIYQGHSRESIIQELGNKIFYEGNGQYVTREEYLSGDVKTKLSLAKTNNDFEIENYDWTVNIEALKEVIPPDLPLSDINYKFGTRFIPISIYQRFLAEQFEQKKYNSDDYNPDWIEIEYDKVGDSYKVTALLEGTYGLRDKFGLPNKKYAGDKLATELLNLRDPKIYKPDPEDPTGNKRILDEVATEALQDKGKMLANAFNDWVLKHPDVQMEIVQIYNEKFNRYVARSYDGSQLTVNGLAKQFKLRTHQANAVMRAVIEGRAGLAHEVGAGKTLTLLASARKMKELDIVKKPLFVIPKPLVEQFGREIYQYFPESHVLIAQPEDFQKDNRKRFVSRILTGKYDFIVIADSQFGKIAMSKEYQENYILSQLNAERKAMEEMEDSSFTVKKIEQRIKQMERALEDLQKKDADSFINFEDLGIDLLIVDEAHNFKNLAPMTQMENVKGVSDTRSQKAMDLQQKTEYLQSQFNNRRVIFSTGTPLSNSVVEMYTMMRYTEPDVLERYGVLNFDTWVSTFGVIENNFELTAAGTFKINRRFVKFGNMQELMNMFRETWDIQTSNMLDLPVPEAEIITHKSPITEAQKIYTDNLIRRASNIEMGLVKPWEDNMLKIVGENKKLSLDMRIIDNKKYTAQDSNKLHQVIQTVFDIYKEFDEQKGTQLIFSDMSVPLKYRNSQVMNFDESINTFSAYDEIKEMLIKKGIPENEIRFIHEATDKTKNVMMQEMREGKIRILLGSTGKAGTGLNVQDKLVAVHHLDVPWRPSDVKQRNGRIIRQGNENKKVQIHYYITPGTMDSFMWQIHENKEKFTDQVMDGTSTAREMEEIEMVIPTATQLKAAANGNPLQAEFMQLEMELQGLERSRNRFYEEKVRSQERILKDQEKLPQMERLIKKQEADEQTSKNTQHQPFELTLHFKDKDKFYTEADKKSEVALALAGRINTSIAENSMLASNMPQHIATYRGFKIYHNPSISITGQTPAEEHLFIKGHAQYSAFVSLESPTGILTRLNNKMDEGIEKAKEETLKDISRIQSAIAQAEEDKAKKFPDEDIYHSKKSRHSELKELLSQQTSEEISSARDVTNDCELEM